MGYQSWTAQWMARVAVATGVTAWFGSKFAYYDDAVDFTPYEVMDGVPSWPEEGKKKPYTSASRWGMGYFGIPKEKREELYKANILQEKRDFFQNEVTDGRLAMNLRNKPDYRPMFLDDKEYMTQLLKAQTVDANQRRRLLHILEENPDVTMLIEDRMRALHFADLPDRRPVLHRDEQEGEDIWGQWEQSVANWYSTKIGQQWRGGKQLKPPGPEPSEDELRRAAELAKIAHYWTRLASGEIDLDKADLDRLRLKTDATGADKTSGSGKDKVDAILKDYIENVSKK